jgi:ribosome-interacting GTPase 1
MFLSLGLCLQLLDLPGIIEGAKDGKGRGRQVEILNYLQNSPRFITY